MPEDPYDKAAALLKKSRHAVALTGAGVSTESSIPDFRGKNGLWSRYDPVKYGTIGAFMADPEKIWAMLSELLQLVDTEPNPGHRALAALEQQGLLAGIITQNIDSLHQKAGSGNVVEFHGAFATFSCLSCGAGYDLAAVRKLILPPRCTTCGNILKPDIVFFDERIPPEVLRRTEQLLAPADLLLVIGTSCQVPPAAHIPFQLFNRGAAIIEVNREPVLKHIATVILEGNFSDVLKRLVARLAQEDV